MKASITKRGADIEKANGILKKANTRYENEADIVVREREERKSKPHHDVRDTVERERELVVL